MLFFKIRRIDFHMYLKDDGMEFNIKKTWIVNNKSSQNEKEKNNEFTPSNNLLNRKGSAKNNEKDLNSILNNAGKLAVGANNNDPILDEKLAQNIVKNLIQENNISIFYSNQVHFLLELTNLKTSQKKNERIDKILSDNNLPPCIYRILLNNF